MGLYGVSPTDTSGYSTSSTPGVSQTDTSGSSGSSFASWSSAIFLSTPFIPNWWNPEQPTQENATKTPRPNCFTKKSTTRGNMDSTTRNGPGPLSDIVRLTTASRILPREESDDPDCNPTATTRLFVIQPRGGRMPETATDNNLVGSTEAGDTTRPNNSNEGNDDSVTDIVPKSKLNRMINHPYWSVKFGLWNTRFCSGNSVNDLECYALPLEEGFSMIQPQTNSLATGKTYRQYAIPRI